MSFSLEDVQNCPSLGLKSKLSSPFISIGSVQTLHDLESNNEGFKISRKSQTVLVQAGLKDNGSWTKNKEVAQGETPNTNCPMTDMHLKSVQQGQEEKKEGFSVRVMEHHLKKKGSNKERCICFKSAGKARFDEKMNTHVFESYFGAENPKKCQQNLSMTCTEIIPNLEGQLFFFGNQETKVQIQKRSFLPFWEQVEEKEPVLLKSLLGKRKLIGRLLAKKNSRPVPPLKGFGEVESKERLGENEYFCSFQPNSKLVSEWISKLDQFMKPPKDLIKIRENCQKCCKFADLPGLKMSDLEAIQPCGQFCKKHEQPFQWINFKEVPWQEVLLSPAYSESLGFLLTFYIKIPAVAIERKTSMTASFVSAILNRNKPESGSSSSKKMVGSKGRKSWTFWDFPEQRTPSKIICSDSLEELEQDGFNMPKDRVVSSTQLESGHSLALHDILDQLPKLFSAIWLKKDHSSKTFMKLINICSFLTIVFLVFPTNVMSIKNIDKYYESFMTPLRIMASKLPFQEQLAESINYAFCLLGLASEFLSDENQIINEEQNTSRFGTLAACDYFPKINTKDLDSFCKAIANGDPRICQKIIANELIKCFPFFITIPEIISQCKKSKESLAVSLSACEDSKANPGNCIQMALGCQRLWQAVFHVTLSRTKLKGLKFLLDLAGESFEKANYFLVSIIQKVLKNKRMREDIQKLVGKLGKKDQEHYNKIIPFKFEGRKQPLAVLDKTAESPELPSIRNLIPYIRKHEIKKESQCNPFMEEDMSAVRREWRHNEALFRASYSIFRIQFLPLNVLEGSSEYSGVRHELSMIFGTVSFLSQLEVSTKTSLIPEF